MASSIFDNSKQNACNNLDVSEKGKFTLYNQDSIFSDQVATDLDILQSMGPGSYHLDNQNSCECGLEEA